MVRAGASAAARRCHPPGPVGHGDERRTAGESSRGSGQLGYRRCAHGKPLWCTAIHDQRDDGCDVVGQCGRCYDYTGHVLFTWWAPEFVAALYDCGAPGLRGELRRCGEHPDGVAVSFVKVVELQARTLGYAGGHASIAAWPATPTAMTWAATPPRLPGRGLTPTSHGCLSHQTMAQQYLYARRMCAFGVRAVALGSGLTRQLPPVGCEHSQSSYCPIPTAMLRAATG